MSFTSITRRHRTNIPTNWENFALSYLPIVTSKQESGDLLLPLLLLFNNINASLYLNTRVSLSAIFLSSLASYAALSNAFSVIYRSSLLPTISTKIFWNFFTFYHSFPSSQVKQDLIVIITGNWIWELPHYHWKLNVDALAGERL